MPNSTMTNLSAGETSALALLLGGLFLMVRGIITWHIPVSFMATLGVGTVVFGIVPWLVFVLTDATFIDLMKLFPVDTAKTALGG